MVDGVRCSCVGLDPKAWFDNPLLDFGLCVSERTGEVLNPKREAKHRSLRFGVSPRANGGWSCSVVGSLHKYKNNNGENWDRFTFSELSQTLDTLTVNYKIDLKATNIHSLEIGVNILLDYSPEIILRNVVCHKGKPFDHLDRRDRKVGLICEHTDYAIKLYNKGYQGGIDKHILRYELKINRQRMLEPFGITTLADLQDVEKVTDLYCLLSERLGEMVFFDYSIKTQSQSLTESKRLNFERYSNPNYWGGLNRNNYYKARKKYAELLQKYNGIDWGKFVVKQMTKEWFELSQIKQKKGRQFPQYIKELESRKWATFSNLEYVVENVTKGDVFKRTGDNPKKRVGYCINCGRQLVGQKEGSLFCSERIYGKAAKRCRNKDSNRRLTIKRKINRAMDKDLMLRVTYTNDGVDYTDTLGATEISITREWLDRVKRVEVLRPQPQIIKNNKAKDYLQTISNQNNGKTRTT